MKNYAKTNVGTEGRAELHEALSLTGAEVSLNRLPAGAGVPFVHAHKNNEEIYGILEGRGTAVIDGETVALDFAGSQAAVFRRGGLRDHLRVHPGKGELSGRLHRRRCHCVLIRSKK